MVDYRKKDLQIKEIDYNSSKLVTMSNAIISGKQAMTLNEAKLLRIIIMQISKEDKERMEYTVNINSLAKMLDIPSSNLYRDVQEICFKLASRSIQIRTGDPKNPWQIFPWLSKAEYDGKGKIHIILNTSIEPYVMQLSELFTQYQMANILTLTSYYAVRIYEILKMYFNRTSKRQHKFTISLEELREMTETTNKYKKNTDFKSRVLDYAKREINNKTDLHIEYILKKTGRRYSHVEFIVNENKGLETNFEIVDKSIEEEIVDCLAEYNIKCTKKQASQLSEAYKGNVSKFKENLIMIVNKNRKSPGTIQKPIGYLLTLSCNEETQHKSHEVAISDDRRESYRLSNELDEKYLWGDL